MLSLKSSPYHTLQDDYSDYITRRLNTIGTPALFCDSILFCACTCDNLP